MSGMRTTPSVLELVFVWAVLIIGCLLILAAAIDLIVRIT